MEVRAHRLKGEERPIATFRLTPDMLGVVDALAQGTGRSRGQVIRDALEYYFGRPQGNKDAVAYARRAEKARR